MHVRLSVYVVVCHWGDGWTERVGIPSKIQPVNPGSQGQAAVSPVLGFYFINRLVLLDLPIARFYPVTSNNAILTCF